MKLALTLTLDGLLRALRWADIGQKEQPVDTGKIAAQAARKREAQVVPEVGKP
jgi:hypothetical protein